jgi:hypothetical protein
MYTALRYNGSEPYTEQLTLSKCACKATFSAGNLTTLLRWAQDDPVSAVEMERNNGTCHRWQHNRNPFVDYPWLSGMYEVQPPIEAVRTDCIAGWTNPEEGVCDLALNSAEPTSMPTVQSQNDTAEPTSMPTAEPTGTMQPTGEPTSEPTGLPTLRPSSLPTQASTSKLAIVQTLTGMNASVFVSEPANALAFRTAAANSMRLQLEWVGNVTVTDVSMPARRALAGGVTRVGARGRDEDRHLSASDQIHCDYSVKVEVGPSAPYANADAALLGVSTELEASTANDCSTNCFNENLVAATAAVPGSSPTLATVVTEEVQPGDISVMDDGSGDHDDRDSGEDDWLFGIGYNEDRTFELVAIVVGCILALVLIHFILKPSRLTTYYLSLYYWLCCCFVSRRKWDEDMDQHFETPGSPVNLDGTRGVSRNPIVESRESRLIREKEERRAKKQSRGKQKKQLRGDDRRKRDAQYSPFNYDDL